MSLHPLDRGNPDPRKYHCPMVGCDQEDTAARYIPECPVHFIQMEEDEE
jgi:hypothetical protein